MINLCLSNKSWDYLEDKRTSVNGRMKDGRSRFMASIPLKIRIACVLFLAMASGASAQVLVTYDLTRTTTAGNAAMRRKDWDEQHVVAALQGLANRKEPRLYVFMVGKNGGIDRFWLNYLHEPGGWLEKYTIEPVNDLSTLVRRFADVASGVVIYDESNPAESVVASTVAGVEGLLPVRYDQKNDSIYWRLTQDPAGPRLAVKMDLRKIPAGKSGSRKCDLTLWAVNQYLKTGRCDAGYLAFYPNAFGLTSGRAPMDRTMLCNHDYFIAHRAFFFDLNVWDDEAPDDDPKQPLGTDLRTLQAVLAAAHARTSGMIQVGGFTPWDQKYTDHTGGKHGGVETEWRYAEVLSCFDAFMDADAPGLNPMANASVFEHFPLKKRYPQNNLPTEQTLRDKGYLDAAGNVTPKNYAAIYVGDYDSAAWLYRVLPEKWNDPNRGKVPLGWAFDPEIERRFPVGLDYARRTATPLDTFVAGDSGYGYLNPGLLVGERKWSGLPSGLSRWEKLCTAGYRRWDLGVTGFIIDGNGPPMSDAVKQAYARFSPAGVVAQKVEHQEMHDGTPFLRMNLDLTNPAKGIHEVSSAFKDHQPTKAHFEIFRTILWTPTQEKTLMDGVHQSRPDIEFVGPYELFLLMKHAAN